MRAFTVLVLFASSAGLIGCSTFGFGRDRSVDYGGQTARLGKELESTRSELEDLKHRNMILEAKLKMRQPRKAALQETPAPIPVLKDLPRKEVIKPAQAKESKPLKSAADLGEQMIYSKIIDTYRMREVTEMKKSVQILLKAYPDSVYADNALFLAGSLGFETGDNAYASLQMERLIQDYPNSNKVVSALMAKAIIAKRQGRTSVARENLLMIKKKYPGSPEALRVSVELKLLDFAASKNKRRET